MGAAVVGGVEHVDVATLQAAAVAARSARSDHGADALAHRSQVHGDVRGVGDQGPGGVEHGAGEVEPLLDVDRIGRGPERLAHLFGAGHEAAVEHLQHDRIGVRADGPPRGEGRGSLKDQVQGRVRRGAPAGFDHGGAGVLQNDGRTVHGRAGTEVGAAIDRRVVIRPRHPHRDAGQGPDTPISLPFMGRDGGARATPGWGSFRQPYPDRFAVAPPQFGGGRRGGGLPRRPHRFGFQRLDHEGLVLGEEAEPLPMQGLERGAHRVGRAEGNHQRGVGPGEFDLGADEGGEGPIGEPLGDEVRARLSVERRDPRGEGSVAGGIQRRRHGRLADGPDLGQPHAIGRQHARERVEHDPRHPQRIGDQTGVLAARAAEAVENIAGDVIAALDRHRFDRLGHVLHRDGDEALGQGLGRRRPAGRPCDLGGQRREACRHGLRVERLVAVGAEHGGELVGPQLAQHDVAVGHRQRSAAAIGGRSRHGPGRLWPDPQPRAVETADRAAPRRHRMDAQHRRPQADARHHGVRGPLIVAGEMRHVGRGAAHVEADDPVEARRPGGPGHADHAARRSGQDRVLAAKRFGRRQPAAGLHEQQRRRRPQIGPDAVDIGPQDRRQIGVGHRGVTAPDQLDQGPDLMTDRNLFEADLAGDLAQPALMVCEAPAVDQDDGHGPEPGRPRRREVGSRPVLVQGPIDGAVGPHPFVDLDDPVVELVVEHDVAGEQIGPALPADPQGVADAAGDGQRHGFALALQQGVGGDGGAHPHLGDEPGGQGPGRDAENPPNPLDRGVGILLGIVREQLARLQRPVGRAGDDVGEGAAPVDPEAPAGPRSRLRDAHQEAPTRSIRPAYRRLRAVCSVRGLSRGGCGC